MLDFNKEFVVYKREKELHIETKYLKKIQTHYDNSILRESASHLDCQILSAKGEFPQRFKNFAVELEA